MARRRADLPGQQLTHRASRASQQPARSLRTRPGQLTFEELTDHTEGKARLQLGAPGPQHPPGAPPRALATLLYQRGLAYPGAAFDHHGPAAVQQRVKSRELPFPFQEHTSTVEPQISG